jgi:hypothetical protein
MTKSASQRNRNNRERGKAFEVKIAKFMKWWRVPYSGSSDLYGLGDVRDHEDQRESRYAVECKSITPKSTKEVNFIIKQDWLIGPNSIVERAKKKGKKIPVLIFTKVRSPLSFAIIKMDDFKLFVHALAILRQQGLITDTKDIEKTRAEIAKLYKEESTVDNTDEEE